MIRPDQTQSIAVSASGDQQLIASPGPGRQICVTSYVLICTGGANSITWKSAANALSGAMGFAANGGIACPASDAPWLVCNQNEALNINLSAATAVAGHLTYRII